MPLSAGEDEKALRDLHAQLSARQPGLHTIQVLSVDPNSDDEWRWLLLSSQADTYREAVAAFTLYKSRNGQAERTLAFDDNEDPLGLYRWWEQKKPRETASADELKFIRESFGKLVPIASREPLEERYRTWVNFLQLYFEEGGSTLWLTIRHRLRGMEKPPVSALFLVFDRPVQDDVLNAIVYRAREFLFDQVLRFYERQIEKQHEVIEKGIREYLLNDPEEMLIADETRDQIKRLRPLLSGRIPLVIEGERGTGKLSVARLAHKAQGLAARWGQPRDLAARSNEPLVINGMWLSGDHAETCGYLKDKEILSSSGELNEAFSADVIFDDLHMASRQAQHVVYRMIERRFGWDGDLAEEVAPSWILVTVSPSLDHAIQHGRLIPELGILSAFKISLPTLHDRLGTAPGERRLAEFRKIVRYLAERARQVIPHSRELVLSDEDLRGWMSESWHDNYWGLRQRVLQEVIASLANEATPIAGAGQPEAA